MIRFRMRGNKKNTLSATKGIVNFKNKFMTQNQGCFIKTKRIGLLKTHNNFCIVYFKKEEKA